MSWRENLAAVMPFYASALWRFVFRRWRMADTDV